MDNRLKISGDIIIGDPCEMVSSEEDWQLCQWGKHMEKLGIKDFLYVDYEEATPTVIDEDGNILGTFCTDSAVVVIMRLNDLLTYNKSFDQHITYPKNWTIIKNFIGTITSEVIGEKSFIVGKGNVSFQTVDEIYE